jgi:hypothetical protein
MEVRMDIQATLDERKKTHGEFENVARCATLLRQALTQCLIEFHKGSANHLSYTQREALCMICSKIGRIVAGNANYKEHWHDIAGYAKLAEQACIEPEQAEHV